MSRSRTYRYSVVQIVPNPVRGERLNLGVVVIGQSKGDVRTRFVGPREEARLKRIQFAADMGFIHDLESEIKASADPAGQDRVAPDHVWDLAAVERASQEWAGTLQLTTPRILVSEAETKAVADELFEVYVKDPKPAGTRARDKRTIKQKVTKGLHTALGQARPDLPFDDVVKINAEIPGDLAKHTYDYRLGNGTVLQLAQTLALEGKELKTAQTDIDAIAWSIDDVRKKSPVPITVVTLGTGKSLAVAETIYNGLGATVVRENQISEWTEKVSKKVAAKVS